jgi:hypothetical protein
MTTQNIEAIDALLATQEYDHQDQKDEIRSSLKRNQQ